MTNCLDFRHPRMTKSYLYTAFYCLISLAFFIGSINPSYGQRECQQGLGLPDTICTGSSLMPSLPASAQAGSVFWDFCAGSALSAPTLTESGTFLNTQNLSNLQVVKEGDNYYAFLLSNTQGNLYRIDFGNDIRTASPSINTVFPLGQLIASPRAISVVRQADGWYGLATSSQSLTYHRLNFSGDITSNPLASSGNLPLGTTSVLRAVRDQGNVYVFGVTDIFNTFFISNYGSNLGGSNNPINRSFNVGSSIVKDLEVINHCGNWYAFVLTNANRLVRMSFGASLANNPGLSDLTNILPSGVNSLDAIHAVSDLGQLHVMATVRSGTAVQLLTLRFNAGATNIPQVRLTNLPTAQGPITSLEMVRTPAGQWLGLGTYTSVQDNQQRLVYLDFGTPCTASVQSFVGTVPPAVNYGTAASGRMTATVTTASGAVFQYTDSTRFTDSLYANPQARRICGSGTVQFVDSACGATGDNFRYLWDFGDGTTDTTARPTKTFVNDGIYNVSLRVSAGSRSLQKRIRLTYQQNNPLANFSFTPNVCTGNPVRFSDNSQTAFDTITNWLWEFGDAANTRSIERNPSFTYPEPGIYAVSLTITGRSGCTSNVTRPVTISRTPLPVIGVSNVCLGQTTQFVDSTLQADVPFTYLWNFGDNTTSTEANPTKLYAAQGNYPVRLTITTAAGCSNTTTRTILIAPPPVANFRRISPALIGDTVRLEDSSVSFGQSIARWEWTATSSSGFVATSNRRIGAFLFPTPDSYLIRLEVTSNLGCTASVQRALAVNLACPTVLPLVPAQTPLQQDFTLTINSQSGINVDYDFCEGDLQNAPVGLTLPIATVGNNRMTVVKDNGRYFGFLTNAGDPANLNNAFIRFDFDSSLANTPRQSLMGNPQNAFTSPIGVKFIRENGTWYGLAINSNQNNNNLVRINFGASVGSTAISTTVLPLPAGVLNRVADFELVKDGDSLYVLAINSQSNANVNNYVRLSFGSSILNNPRPTILNNPIPFQSGSGLSTLMVLKQCNLWFVYVAASSGQVFRLDYGITLQNNTPIISNITTDLNAATIPATALLNITGMAFGEDQQYTYLYFLNANGQITRARYLGDVRRPANQVDFQANWSLLSNTNGLTLVKDGSAWYAFSADRSNGRLLYRMRFPDNCSAQRPSLSTPVGQTISNQYASSGTYFMSYAVSDALGNRTRAYDSIVVIGNREVPLACPTGSFNAADQVCINTDINLNLASLSPGDVEIDLCAGDLASPPISPTTPFTIFPSPIFPTLEVAREGTDYFGFIVQADNNRLQRLAYGNSLGNNPTITDLGVTLPNTFGIKIFRAQGSWFGLVTLNQGSGLQLLQFGNRLTNIPTAVAIGTGTFLRSPRSIEVITEGDQTIALIANQSFAGITVLRFGKSVINLPEFVQYPVEGASSTNGISMIRECNRWYGIATDNSGNGLIHIAFPNGINAPPVLNRIANSTVTLNAPLSCRVIREGRGFYLFLTQNAGDMVRMTLGTSIANPLFGVPISGGNFGGQLNAMNGFAMERNDLSQWFLVGYTTNRNLVRYSWNNNCAASPAIVRGRTQAARYTNTGVFQLAVRYTDTSGRVAYYNDSVQVRNPIIGRIGQVGNRCIGSPLQFIDQSITVGSGIPPIRQWNFGDTVSSVIQSTDINPVKLYRRPGNYTVTLRLIESSGCTTIVTRQIAVLRKPAVNFNFLASACSNDSVRFTDATPLVSDTIRTWEYRLDGNVVSRNRNFALLFPVPGFFNMSLRITTAGGCDTSMTRVVRIDRVGASVDFRSPSNICFGDTTQFASIIDSIGIPIRGVSWALDAGVFSTQRNPRYRYPTPGTRRVSLTVSNANNCQSSVSRTITVFRRPVGIITLASLPCVGFPTQFGYNLSQLDGRIVRTEWTFGDGGTDTSASPLYVYSRTGSYPVSLRLTTSGGCTAVLRDTLEVSPSPTAKFGVSVACAGRFSRFTDSSDAGPLPGGVTAYAWDFGNGQTSDKVMPDSVLYLIPGRYTVSLTIQAGGCPNTSRRDIIVPGSPSPVIAVKNGCDGVAYELADSSLLSGLPMPAGSTRIWSVNGQTSTERVIRPLLPIGQSYNVVLTSLSPEGCQSTTSTTITPTARPIAGIQLLDSVFDVAPFRVRLRNRATNASTVFYDFGDGTTSTDANPTHFYTTEGVYVIRQIVTNGALCSDTLRQVVNVVRNVLPDIAIDNLTLTRQANRTQVNVEIRNKGNVEIRTADLQMQLDGALTFVERWQGSLMPGGRLSYNFRSSVLDSIAKSPSIICVSAQPLVKDRPDQNLSDNSRCRAFQGKFEILQLAPNPARERVKVIYNLPNDGNLRAQIVNLNGQIVKTLFEGNQTAGLYQPDWAISELESGLYYLQIYFDNEVKTLQLAIRD